MFSNARRSFKSSGRAIAYREAEDIRAYVNSVLASSNGSSGPPEEKHLREWVAWARLQADEIDPIKGQRFLDTLMAVD